MVGTSASMTRRREFEKARSTLVRVKSTWSVAACIDRGFEYGMMMGLGISGFILLER